MTNSAKRYSTRAASIAVGTAALALLIWAIIAFAGGSVTVNPSTVPIGTKVTAKLSGGFANASSYYAEYWGPTANNAADDAAHRMRCYSTVRKNTLATFSTAYTTNGSTNYQGSNWTARYLYNPNYYSPQFVVFDAPLTSVATGTTTYKFHLVDRWGKMILATHLSDMFITLTRVGGSTTYLTTSSFTFSGGYYSGSYNRTSAATMILTVKGLRTSKWFSSYTSAGTATAKETKDFYWSNTKKAVLLVSVSTPTSGNAYRITPAGGHATFATNTTINTSGEKRSSMIYAPGTTNPYRYVYQFDVFDNGASQGGTPAAVTSGVTLLSATAQGAGGNATPFNNTSSTATTKGLLYINGHWQVKFNLAGPDKYGINIRVVKGNILNMFQVVNLAATSPAFTVSTGKTPPANPSSFVATPGDRKVSFGWTNPPNPGGGTLKGIIICRKLDNNPFDAPADGTSYNVGGVVQASPGSSGASTVVYKLDPASAGATGQAWNDGDPCPGSLTTGGSYYYKAFAYDTQYSYSSGVSSASNNPAVPYDATLPGVVTPVTTGVGASNGVAPLDKASLLTWTPSSDCDYHGVIIYANTAGWPTSSTGADGSRLLVNTPNAYKTGGNESYKDTPLNNGTQVYYSVWTRDDDGNVNSTPVHFGPMAPRDTEVPGQVSGSAAPAVTAPAVIAHDAFTATLQWYAPADNGYDAASGNATAYDIRYVGTDDPVNHPFPITDANWSKAFPTGGAAAPSPASKGTVQTYKIEGLSPNQHYYFAIRARDEVFNWSTTSVNGEVDTICNNELTGCNQCHQMPPTDGLPGEHPRSVGNIGAHYLPIHTGGGNPKQCNVCHANGNVYNEFTHATTFQFNHQNDVINMNYSGLIGNKLWRDNRTGGKFVAYTIIVHKNQHTGYSTAVGYKQLTGYCVNTYCHGQGAGAASSPVWGMESVSCGQTCHETPPATGKHVKHYHPGKYYINEAPVNHTPVSGYTNDTSTAFWNPSNLTRTATVDNGGDMSESGHGNADPRYATYIASSNAVRTLPGLSQNTTYYVTVCVGDSAGVVTDQYVALSNSSSGPWTTILSGGTSDTRLFKKTVDYPFLVSNGSMYMKIGDGIHTTKLNYFIVNVSPEAPTSNNTVLANTTDEYGFACGKCHYTSDNPLEKHTNHVGGPYRYTVSGNNIVRTRDAEIVFDINSNPKNPTTSNYTAIFGTATSYMDGQRSFYTLGSQCKNLYCHGSTLDAGGSNTEPRWTGGYIDEQGSSICGSCHAANYKASEAEQINRNMTTGSHKKHVVSGYPYMFSCSDCHNATVNVRAADGSESVSDKTHHVNGVVEVVFDPNDPTMKLGHYSAIATPKYGYCINVYCHSNGLLNPANQPFGATRYAKPQWSVSRNVPCDFCHGSGSVDGTPLYLTSATTFNSHAKHTKTNGIKCGICHNRTVGYDGQTVIQKNNTCFHVNGLIDVYFNYSVVKVSGGNNPSYSRGTRLCANTYCHGTAVPIWGGTVLCNSCHATPPNYGRHDVHSQGNFGNLTTGNTGNANKSSGYNYDFDCRFCHYQRSHGTGAASGVQAAEVNFNTIDVQNAYNNTGGIYTAGLTGTSDDKGWNYTAGTCSVKCHGDGKGGPPNIPNYKWTDAVGSLGCFGCHGGVLGDTPEINTGAHLAHIDTAPYAFTCDNCHNETASLNNVAHAEKHVNGTVDVVIKGGGTYSGGACSGTYCHSNGNPGFDRGSANYYATSPDWSGGLLTCTTCHSDNHYSGGDGVRTAGQTLSYSHQRHLSNYTASFAGYGSRIGCATCHNKTASSNTVFQTTGTTHDNGAKEVVFWTASTAGTAPRTKFVNMTGPASAVVLTGIWGDVNNQIAGKDLSCTVLCHSDGRGNPPNRMPNWSTAQATYGCGSCHGYAVSGFNNMTSGSHMKHVAGASNYPCGTCHRLTAGGAFGAAFINRSGFLRHHVDGNVDVKIALSIGGTYDSGTKTCSGTVCHGAQASPAWGTGTTNCLTCHDSPPRNAQHFGHYSATAGGQVVTANNTADGSTAAVYQFGCGKCHLTPPAKHAQGNVKSNQSAEIGFDAGTNPMNPNPGTLAMYTTTNFRLYTSKGGTFRESKGLCRNLYCHSNGQSTLTYAFINWSTKGTSVTCASCHKGADTKANMLAGGLAGAHPAHAATDTYGITCDKCHKFTASSNTAISARNNHVNGAKEVNFAVQAAGFPNLTGYYYSTPTYNCRNTYCHSDGNGGHTGTQIAWNAAGPLACTACHLGNAASGSPITTGKHTAHINNADSNITKYGCVRCHSNTVSGDTALLASKAYHVNGAKDVFFQTFNSTTGFYVAATKTCRSNYCHSSGQATPAFRTTTGWARPWTANCNSCHGCDVPADFTPKNGEPNYANVSSATRNTYNSHKVPGHVSSANDCIHCHLHTVNSFGGLTTATTQHIDGTRQVIFQQGGSYDPVRKICTNTACHGSTGVRWGGPAQNCSACHSDMGAGFKNTQHYFTGKHLKHTSQTTYRYACELCHATKNASGNIGHATGNVSTNQGAEVVFQSSTTMWRNFTYKNTTTFRYIRMNYLPGTATLTNIAYQPGAYVAGSDNPDTLNTVIRWTNGRCTNVWCHSNGQSTPTYNQFPNWSSAETSSSCTYCHGDKTSNTLTTKHRNHLNNISTLRFGGTNFECAHCHKATVNSGSTPVTGFTKHVNGTRDVNFQAFNSITGGYVSGTQTCRNNYCHSDGRAKALSNVSSYPAYQALTWTAGAWASGTKCRSCHGTEGGSIAGEPRYANRSTASATKAWFNSHAQHVSSASDCIDCHLHTVDSFGNLTTGTTLHIDGTRNVVFQLGGTYNGALKTCQNTNSNLCHGGNTVVWGGWRNGDANCASCHLTAAGVADTDDFYFGNGIKAMLAYNEYTSVGHGKAGNYAYSGNAGASNSSNGAHQVTACETCHDSTVAHNNYTSLIKGNFFRLKGGGDPNTLCTTAVGCHTTTATAHHNQANTAGDATWVFTPKCIDCHEPHGDNGPNGRHNAYMVQKLVNYTTASATSGVPAGSSLATPNPLGVRKAMNFPGNVNQPVLLSWTSFVRSANTGLCQVCHTRGTGSETGTSPGNYSRNQYMTAHNPGGNCTDCHTHDVGFKGAGGDCTICHGTGGSATGPTKRRDMQKEFTNSSSHHIVGSVWGTSIKGKDCAACHAEGDYATGSTTTWHNPGGTGGKAVYLKNWTGVFGTTQFKVISTIRAADSGTTTSKLIRNSAIITQFCIGCHSNRNKPAIPFTDGKTPIAYAWSNNSVERRYSNNSTTPWGKFNSATYNVVPADMVTKAFSPHGNVQANDMVMSIASFSILTTSPSKVKPVACYDCHNAHASNVAGGTSYKSDNNEGGILKCYTSPGGALVGKYTAARYLPRAGGSSGTKNAYSSSSALCFDCHIDGAASAAPKNYTTFGLKRGKTIAGSYYDRVGNMQNFDNWSSTRWSTDDVWRGSFAFKDAKFVGGHFGKSVNWMQVTKMGTLINDGMGGQCVKCHDPHGTSPAIKRGFTNPVRTINVNASTGTVGISGTLSSGAWNDSLVYVVQLTSATAFRVSNDGGATFLASTGTVGGAGVTDNGLTITVNNATSGTYAADDTWTFLAGVNPNYMVPALKGTWMHSPYKEDRPPRSTYTNDTGVNGGHIGAQTKRLGGLSGTKVNDYTVYADQAAWNTVRRLWDDNAGGYTAAGTGRMIGGPAPRGNPDFKTGSYEPGFNTPAVQGDGFGVGPYRLYGNAQVPTLYGFTNVTSYKGWNGYFIDENTFGTESATIGAVIVKPSTGFMQRSSIRPVGMTDINAAATPGNFAGLCLECHAWRKSSSALGLRNITSANLATGGARITALPHEAVFGLSTTISVDLFTRAELYSGTAYTASAGNTPDAWHIHGLNYAQTNYGGYNSGVDGVTGLVSAGTNWGAYDTTANSSGTQYSHYYRWGVNAVSSGQRTLGYKQSRYHSFPCSKCHTAHVSRLPRLMKTNCLDNDNVGRAHTTMGYVTDGTTADTTSTALWGALFRNMACHSTKIGVVNRTGSTYVPGGWNNHTPW